MRNLILLTTFLTLFGRDCPKKVTTHITTDTNCRYNVTFISIGAGTDGNAKKQFDQYLADYEQKNKVQLGYEKTPWGKEGEVDYCLMLTALDQKKQEQFILQTKELLKKSSLVRYSENVPCEHKK